MKATVYKTCRSDGSRLKKDGVYELSFRNTDVVETRDKSLDIEQNIINIHPQAEYHTFLGIGGAFTETAALGYGKLSAEKQKEFIRAYFDKTDGIGYTAGRLHINSCDFSVSDYTYIREGDKTLESFDISHDTENIIPMVKAALGETELWLFASPWTPPRFMKTVDAVQGGHLKKEYYRLWARYTAEYIKAYRKNGVEIQGVTVQNEPRHNQMWESCLYTPEEESEYIGYLYDELKGLNVKILCYDHCRERLFERAEYIFGGKNGAYCDGIANHWYSGDHFGEIRAVRNRWNGKLQVASEACCFSAESGIKTEGIWSFAEKYAHDIGGALNAGCNAWVDWNLAVDENNGPSHHREGREISVDTAVYCDTSNDRLVYQPTYYYIGHYSRFIRPGAKCIASSSYTEKLEVCAFKNKNGEIVCVILNRTDKRLPFILRLGNYFLDAAADGHSIQSIIINKDSAR